MIENYVSLLSNIAVYFNVMLFGLFSFLSLKSMMVYEKIQTLKIQRNNEFVRNINKNEILVFCIFAAIFLFLIPTSEEQLSISVYLLSFINEKFSLPIEIIELSLLLFRLGSFISFTILIIGIFYTFHKKQILFLKPSRIFEESKKKLNIMALGIILTVIFGFYPLYLV